MHFDKVFDDTQLLELFNLGICVLDIDLNVKYWNSWISYSTKVSQEELKDKKITEVFTSVNEQKLKRQIKAATIINSPTYFTSKDGYLFPIPLEEITNPIYEYMQQYVTIYPLGNSDVLITIEDQTSLKEANKKVKDFTKLLEEKRKLIIDRLTGLPNRNQLIVNLESNKNKKLALLNIDGFNEINDFYGFEIGDLYLKDIAQKLQKLIELHKLELFKLSADEYAIYSANSKEMSEEDFIVYIKNIVADIESMYFEYKDNKISIFVSSGISFDQDKTLETADIALKKCKKLKIGVVVYDKSISITEVIKEKHKWFETLKDAIVNNRIKAFYQPIYNIKTKRIEKYETLVRLIDKDGMIISPFFFLDISKQAKLYSAITSEVIKQSFEKFKDSDYEFSLNISVEDIEHIPTRNLLFSYLRKYPDVASRLVVELLEDEGIENFDLVNEFITKVKFFGAKIAIDDFGTGYSNFSHLLKLDVDYLKIDASLIKNIHEDENSRKIVETLVDFSEKIGAKTIGEFVHSKDVFDKISKENLHYAQGYFVQEPKEEIGFKPLWSN